MYLRGLKSLGDDYSVDPYTGDVTLASSDPLADAINSQVVPPPDFPSLPSDTPPTAMTPWTSLATGALNIWSKISSAQNAQGASTPVQYPLPSLPQGYTRDAQGRIVAIGLPPARAGYSPFPATGVSAFSSGAGGILLPLAIGAGVFFVIRGVMK